MSWNYRVVKHVASHPDEGELYAIHEAYYREGEDEPHSVTKAPITSFAESPEVIREILGLMAKALEKPILDYQKIGNIGPPDVYTGRHRLTKPSKD